MTTLFSSYFFRKRLRDSILLKTYLFSAFALLLSLLAIALTMGGHVLTDAGTPLIAAMGGFSLLFSTLSVHITNQLKRTIDKFNTDNYSNVEDFPYRFAQLVLYLPLCWIALMWAVFVSDSRWCKLAVDLITSAAMIYMLCIILHPQQLFTNKQEPDPANDGSKDTATTDSPSEIDAIGNEVLSEIPKGKVNAASKYITQLGYYNLVNMFRLQHAALYKEAHPAAKQEEIAEESGFSSRTAYYKARKSVAAIDDKIVKSVKL